MSQVIMAGNGGFYGCLSEPRGGKKQHKHMYLFFLVPCCGITLNLNQSKPSSYYP